MWFGELASISLYLGEKVADLDVERVGHVEYEVQARCPQAAFDAREMGMICEADHLRKLLLREALPFTLPGYRHTYFAQPHHFHIHGGNARMLHL